jgi:hypothetical protein
MRCFVIDGIEKIKEEMDVISRLDVFNPAEMELSTEFHSYDLNARIDAAFNSATRLLKVAKVQLEQESFAHLEFSVHKLRSLFLAVGCDRLSFLFEKIYKNLSKINVVYLRELFSIAYNEFDAASEAVMTYLQASVAPSALQA